jgi:hypothetical protein
MPPNGHADAVVVEKRVLPTGTRDQPSVVLAGTTGAMALLGTVLHPRGVTTDGEEVAALAA